MNNISWLIYTIQVIGSFSTCLHVLCVFAILITIAIWITKIVGMCIDEDESKAIRESPIFNGVWPVRWIYIIILLAIVGSFVPNRQTLILIAGSEIGDKFIHSKTGNDIIDPSINLLQNWIKSENLKLLRDMDKKD